MVSGKVGDILCEQTIGGRALCLSLTGGDGEIFPFRTRHDDDILDGQLLPERDGYEVYHRRRPPTGRQSPLTSDFMEMLLPLL